MRRPAVVRLVGHGSSDNAASYAVYAFGLLPGWTALRDSISLSVYYGADLDLSQSCVVALSQSGRTHRTSSSTPRGRGRRRPDDRCHERSRFGPRRRLRGCAAARGGFQQAVAATKAYTTQIAALLAGGAKEDGRRIATGIQATAELMRELRARARAARLGARDDARLHQAGCS